MLLSLSFWGTTELCREHGNKPPAFIHVAATRGLGLKQSWKLHVLSWLHSPQFVAPSMFFLTFSWEFRGLPSICSKSTPRGCRQERVPCLGNRRLLIVSKPFREDRCKSQKTPHVNGEERRESERNLKAQHGAKTLRGTRVTSNHSPASIAFVSDCTLLLFARHLKGFDSYSGRCDKYIYCSCLLKGFCLYNGVRATPVLHQGSLQAESLGPRRVVSLREFMSMALGLLCKQSRWCRLDVIQ
eukprot:s580_g32.t1